MRLIGFCDTPGWAYGVYISGCYAYIADYFGGLRIIDISNPRNPYEVGYCETPGYDWGIDIFGSYAFVANHWAGLRIVNISNPKEPREISYYLLQGITFDVYISNNYAYVANGMEGIRIIDISDPQNPYKVGYYNTPGECKDVFVLEPYIFVADYYNGFQIYEFYGMPHIEEKVVNEIRCKIISNLKERSIILKFNFPLEKTTFLYLYNSFGQIIKIYKLEKGIKEKILNLKENSQGIYFLKFIGKNAPMSIKMILNK